MSDLRRSLNTAFEVKVVGTLEKAVRRTALSVDRELVMRTPVDTGRARSNWLPSLNIPDVNLVEPGEKPDMGAAIQNYKISDTIYLSNNLPYIRALNDGSSQQAPAGFIEAAVLAGVKAVNR